MFFLGGSREFGRFLKARNSNGWPTVVQFRFFDRNWVNRTPVSYNSILPISIFLSKLLAIRWNSSPQNSPIPQIPLENWPIALIEWAMETDNYRIEKKTGFFNILTGFFSRGPWKMSPVVCMSYWSIFNRNLVGLADFAGSKSQRMANWPSFDKKNGNWENYAKRAAYLVQFTLFQKKKKKLGQLAIRWNFEPAKSANPTINRFLSKIDQ